MRSRNLAALRMTLVSTLGMVLGMALGPARSLPAQAVTIDPGMTREQVVAKLGQPLSIRAFESHTYMLYKNGCEKTCGMNDLVVLDGDKVVDAVFRGPNRKYSGKSSSPVMITAIEARKGVATPALKSPPSSRTPPKKPNS